MNNAPLSSETTAENTAQEIVRMFDLNGSSMYGGEAVTQREHALQCAHLAELQGAAPALIVASLLHDIGHLLHALPDDAPESGVDDLHEELAAHWLNGRFGPDVVEPVRLHVAAKRFLCATDSIYYSRLSQPSQLSLKLQGGPMSSSEINAFMQNPFYRDAVRLRRWDDEAKIVGFQTPSVSHYVSAILQVASKA